MEANTAIEVDILKLQEKSGLKFDCVIDGDLALIESISEFPAATPLKMQMNVILFCIEGSARFDVNCVTERIDSGEVTFILTGNELRNWRFSKDAKCRIIFISDRLVRASLNSNLDLWNRAFYIHDLRKLPMEGWFENYFMFIREKLNEPPTPHKKQVLLALVQAVLLDFCDHLEEELDVPVSEKGVTQGNLLFQRFLALLEKTEPKRQTVDYYSNELCVSPKYLSMVCKMMSQKTTSEWIRSYVDADIRMLLHRADMSIKEVAEKLGFENISFFGKYVRARFGCSPRKFRQRMQSGE
ncbi:MAG: helix-turn-helix domain-containing protein [Paludibacteraceae bacterium]|nr:AraC family transcriptional regulator [Paludibacteraceae bacterium]MCR5568613.1 helix-turn-helix domain-containing protein [Paludibacteraceae bacterium]